MRLCYYEKPTIFCRWVRSAVAVFKAWAALSRSCTILVFGVTADGVTVKVFVWAAPPAEGFWVLRSWHRSPKRSANDFTPAQRSVTLVLLAQQVENKKKKNKQLNPDMLKIKMVNYSPGVPVTTFSCATESEGLARSSGFWGLESRLGPLVMP